ncbi:SLC13 family permease [Ningiella sp. W23]|uniref:SLC13 family permease n=1 Tax=Ningiella sp. W23 TaxID=3023715 RepID=UPI0037578EDA
MTDIKLYRTRSVIVGAAIAIVAFIISQLSQAPFNVSLTVAIVLLCAIWWATEAIPIPITACIPLSIFPLSGIISRAELGGALGNPINLLLIGGFILSIAMVNTKAHLRIASVLFSLIKPQSEKQLIIAFMLCAAFLSMWISNAAAAMMLIPAALAVIEQNRSTAKREKFKVPLLLGICYAASVGGLATPIGTPPNLVFIQAYEQATGLRISFIDWMKWGLPCVLVLLPIVMLYLTRKYSSSAQDDSTHRIELSRISKREQYVLFVFVLVILAWMTRADPYGGWSEWLSLPNAHDGYVAILGAIALFIIPVQTQSLNGNNQEQNGEYSALLTWDEAKHIPWGVILLISGGIAISIALRNTGLIGSIAESFSIFKSWPLWLMIGLICLSVAFITEIMSNTACAALIMPILAALAISLDLDPLLFMLPAAMCASCAFMMPMATAPNAIVFATNQLSIKDMIREGTPLNFIAVFVVVLVLFLLTSIF